MKKLPDLYKNLNMNPINNNKSECILKENNISKEEVLDKIFNGLGHSYNTKVIIRTKNKVLETYLVSKTNKNIVTLDNEVINIEDIEDISIK